MHLDRLIEVLETVSVIGTPVTTQMVHQVTGIPKPSCYRIVQTLEESGLLDKAEDGAFTIGQRLIQIALLGQSDIDLRRVAEPHLRAAARMLNETIFLARYRNGQVEIVVVETPEDPQRAYIHPGLGIRPMHACSCSKAIAAFADKTFQDEIINTALKKYTDFTKITPGQVRLDFQNIRREGYAVCDQEIDAGIASVAAPVSVRTVGAVFSVGAVGPIRRFKMQDRQRIGRALIEFAKHIASAIQLTELNQDKEPI